jgi:hypothetical protein
MLLGTVYIETVSPLSTLNRYQVHLGSKLKISLIAENIALLLEYHYYFSFLFFLQKYIEKKSRFFLYL